MREEVFIFTNDTPRNTDEFIEMLEHMLEQAKAERRGVKPHVSMMAESLSFISNSPKPPEEWQAIIDKEFNEDSDGEESQDYAIIDVFLKMLTSHLREKEIEEEDKRGWDVDA